MSKNPLLIQVPGSTSNCGPGFDTLSIALSLHNFIKLVPRADERIRSIDTGGERSQAMVEETAGAFAQLAGVEVGGFDYEIWGEVPPARGLGSSSTIRAAVMAGLNRWAGDPLDEEALIRLTAKLDNAPDNACAAFVGGFCIARTDPKTGGYREHVRFELDGELVFTAVSPDYEVMTENARRVLPDMLPFKDAVRSANSLAFLVGVLATRQYGRLRHAVDDYLHQPYREPLNPFGHEAIEAGCGVGAYTGWLSGSGSTVVCVSEAGCQIEVAKAMQGVYTASEVPSRALRLTTENAGLKLGVIQ